MKPHYQGTSLQHEAFRNHLIGLSTCSATKDGHGCDGHQCLLPQLCALPARLRPPRGGLWMLCLRLPVCCPPPAFH